MKPIILPAQAVEAANTATATATHKSFAAFFSRIG
jgi:hypothetical protein